MPYVPTGVVLTTQIKPPSNSWGVGGKGVVESTVVTNTCTIFEKLGETFSA